VNRHSVGLNSLDDSALTDEDTIEELTFVLSADLAGLAKLGASKGNGFLVDTFEDKFVLDVSAEADSAAGLEDNLLDLATTKEVLELNEGSILSDVGIDGEMSVDESHLVLDTLKATASLLLI
tara:strand:- start:229 stop:597 length:369 start_codon:yes stop_codon:yes gene_type:complete